MTIINFPTDDDGRVLLYCTAIPEAHCRSTDEYADLEVTAFISSFADGSVTVGDHELSRDQAIALVRAVEIAILYATPTVKPDGTHHYTCADQDGAG